MFKPMSFLVALTSVLVLFSRPAVAQMPLQDSNYPYKKVNDLKIGVETSYIHYREPSVAVKETGAMGGVYGIYNFRPDWPNASVNVFHLDGHVDAGEVSYRGSGKINNVPDYMFEPRAWVGKDFNFELARVTPYIGLGYRLLYDDLSGKTSSTGASGYLRRSQYLYAPVGFELASRDMAGWQIGLTGEYDIFIQGWQKSYLSDIAGFPDITNRQKRGFGLRGSIDIMKKMDNLNLIISPYIRYWHIKQSNTAEATGTLFQISGYEPENKSTEIGLQVAVQF